MQDIPFFTTDNGIASLALNNIPYGKKAYILLRDASDPEALLRECVDFACMAGAETVYASGLDFLEKYPYHVSVWKMCRDRAGLPDPDAALFPVQESTVEKWRQIYNQRMASVEQAAYMTFLQAKKMLSRGDGYFVHRGQELLGIGIAAGDTVQVVASVKPGGGRDTLLALNHALSGDTICVELASTNEKAMRLYESLGFLPACELYRWYRIK